MTDKELFTRVLESLESLNRTGDTQVFDMFDAPVLIPALRARLAQSDGVVLTSMRHPEILAVDENADVNPESLETIEIDLPEPEKVEREWVGLTYADLYFWGGELGLGELGKGVLRAVDAHLRKKNT